MVAQSHYCSSQCANIWTSSVRSLVMSTDTLPWPTPNQKVGPSSLKDVLLGDLSYFITHLLASLQITTIARRNLKPLVPNLNKHEGQAEFHLRGCGRVGPRGWFSGCPPYWSRSNGMLGSYDWRRLAFAMKEAINMMKWGTKDHSFSHECSAIPCMLLGQLFVEVDPCANIV